MDMQHHLTGMWVNFILSALVVVVVVASMIRTMNRQERIISAQREEQLRQEQLLSLGAAAAQFAHRLATPLATANLLAEELREVNEINGDLEKGSKHHQEFTQVYDQLDQQLASCRRHLDDFRLMAEQVKNNTKHSLSVTQLISDLQQEVQLSFPKANLIWQIDPSISEQNSVYAEVILLPALLNLIQNAIVASNSNNSQRVEVSVLLKQQTLCLQIKDDGQGFADDTLLQLGSALVDSDSGLGMGVFLSHVTLEKMGGTLKLFNRSNGGAVAEINLPLNESDV
jgi:two-component system sensor histidine kinase RegB